MDAKWTPWIERAVALLVIALLVIAWNQARSAKADLVAEQEKAMLKAKGLLVAEQEKRAKLEAEKKQLEADLQAAVDEAKKAAPGSHVSSVERLDTGPVVAHGAPRPSNPRPEGRSGPINETCASPTPSVTPPLPPFPPFPPFPPSASEPPCLLAEGDEGGVKVTEVEVSTKAGNTIVVGKATCYRLSPPPETPIITKLFDSKMSNVSEEQKAKLPGWGGGIYGGASSHGWVLGPALAFPPLRVFGRQLELTGGVGLGSDVQGSATLIVR